MTKSQVSAEAIDQLTQQMQGRVTLVIDTSVLAADPSALFAFPDCDIVIPLTVIEELDGLKTRQDQIGANARAVVRHLEKLRVEAGGSLKTAVDLPDNATLKVEPNGLRLDEIEAFHLPADKADHRILAAALGQMHDNRNTIFVSCDGAARLKADTLGLVAKDYEANNAPFTTKDKPGWQEVEISSELSAALFDTKTSSEKFRTVPIELDIDKKALADVVRNEFVIAKCGNSSALARREADGLRMLAPVSKTRSWDLQARNKEQQFALDLLVDPRIQVAALSGRAGTGKTILAIAAALEQTFERENIYDRVMILRPMYSIGRQDIGFLPGEVEDKVAPWFDAVVDAMVALSTVGMGHKEAKDMLSLWVDSGRLAMEPVTFLRGRSLTNTAIILDEAQNFETSEIKTILTRLGEGSKIVVVGDPEQCDNPFTTVTSNGLTTLVAAFRGQDLFGHVELTECERSRVADLAADLL